MPLIEKPADPNKSTVLLWSDVDLISVDQQSQFQLMSEHQLIDDLLGARDPPPTSNTTSVSKRRSVAAKETTVIESQPTQDSLDQSKSTMRGKHRTRSTRPELPPLHHSRVKDDRSVRSRRQPHFSPINERRTDEEKLAAKERTKMRKEALRAKREVASLCTDAFHEILDGFTAVTAYQVFYQQCMQRQAEAFCNRSLLNGFVGNLVAEVASEALRDE